MIASTGGRAIRSQGHKGVDTLSCSLQSVTMNGADGREVAMAAVNHLKDWRTEE